MKVKGANSKIFVLPHHYLFFFLRFYLFLPFMAVSVCQNILMSSQVCVKVRHHWPTPEWGALQSSAAISTPHPPKERVQISFPFMWWSGCASATMFPSSSNLECTLRGFTQTTRVSSAGLNHALLSYFKAQTHFLESIDFFSLIFFYSCIDSGAENRVISPVKKAESE